MTTGHIIDLKKMKISKVWKKSLCIEEVKILEPRFYEVQTASEG